MTTHTHETAPTQFVEANGVRFAYRRFGKPGGVPIVFNQHFQGTLDHWDPAVTDGLARDARSDPVRQCRRRQPVPARRPPASRRWAPTPSPSSGPWA